MIIILYRGIDDKYMCLYIIILSIYSQFTRLRGEGGLRDMIYLWAHRSACTLGRRNGTMPE